MKNENGAITLYVTVACLFILIIGITSYIGASNKQAAQMAELKKIEASYNNPSVTAEELYQSYDGGDIVPIYTPEQFALVGSGEEVYVAETGKFYTFSVDKTYMFYGVPEDLEYLMSTLKEEIKEEVKVEIGTNDVGVVQVGALTLTKSTNQLVNSLAITATASSENGITTYVPPDNNEKIYESGTTEITETYEITKNGTYVFSVVEGDGTISDAEIVITNIVLDEIGMELSTEYWTTPDVIVTITWPDGSAKGKKEIKIDDGEWTRYTGLTTELTISENCTVHARVTNGADDIKTNSVTIDKIDPLSPIVTPVEVSEAYVEDVIDIELLWTYDVNGIAPVSSVTYLLNGQNIKNADDIDIYFMLVPGENTITCTVAKENGTSTVATNTIKVLRRDGGNATEITKYPKSYYGQVVSNYTCTNGAGVNNWKIFYADSCNIYLIADDYVHSDYIPNGKGGTANSNNNGYVSGNNAYVDYTGSASILDTSITDERVQKWIGWVSEYPSSTNVNIRSVAYMLDTNIWGVYKNTTYADYAIGRTNIRNVCGII